MVDVKDGQLVQMNDLRTPMVVRLLLLQVSANADVPLEDNDRLCLCPEVHL
jgi:hypothetical protein